MDKDALEQKKFVERYAKKSELKRNLNKIKEYLEDAIKYHEKAYENLKKGAKKGKKTLDNGGTKNVLEKEKNFLDKINIIIKEVEEVKLVKE